MKTLIAVLLPFLLCGCANLFETHYVDLLGNPAEALDYVLPNEGEPQFKQGVFSYDDYLGLFEEGYQLMGYSYFNTSSWSQRQAISYARQLKAHLVLVASEYTNTVSGTVPLNIPNPDQTITTHHFGSAYGSYGYGNYVGTSTTTIPGGHTTYNIPYSVNYYDVLGTFWIKTKPDPLGAIVADLTTERKRQIGRNRGVEVVAVQKGSPAYHADIVAGDILLSVFGNEIIDRIHLASLIVERKDKPIIILHYLRNGKKDKVHVRLEFK